MSRAQRAVWEPHASPDNHPRTLHVRRPGGSVQPTSLQPAALQLRGPGTPAVERAQPRVLDTATFVSRGPLATRAHGLLGLGPVGAARRGQAERSLAQAFGGDPASWQQVGAPWIAARSLARQVETLPGQSAVGWFLGSRPG